MASYMGELRRLVGARPLFSVGVSVALQDGAGRLLLQRRSDSGLWGLPGGGVEPGETLQAAAHRELWEETGLADIPLTPDFVISGPTFRHVYPHGDVVYLVGQAFRGQLSSEQFAGAGLGAGGETLELGLFALAEPPTVPEEWGDFLPPLRALVGPRPLFSPGASVICLDDRGRVLPGSGPCRAAECSWARPSGMRRGGSCGGGPA